MDVGIVVLFLLSIYGIFNLSPYVCFALNSNVLVNYNVSNTIIKVYPATAPVLVPFRSTDTVLLPDFKYLNKLTDTDLLVLEYSSEKDV